MTHGHEQKVRSFYDVAGPAYEKLMGYTWHHGLPEAEAAGMSFLEAAQELEKQLVAASGLRPGELAMDFGSGIGGETLYMAELSGARFVGVSNNENLCGRARELTAEAGLADRVHFYSIGDTDYQTLCGFPDESFDAVFFYESICHLPAKETFFASAYRLLKPGRRLVGIDWLQRPFGEYQTPEQIERVMAPVNRTTRIPGHGSVDTYRSMMEKAGFRIEEARDLFAGTKCWGGAPEEDRPAWLNYDGAEGELFQEGKRALDAARDAGTFTVGMFIAVKDSSAQV